EDRALHRFLHVAAEQGRAAYGLNHGEHVLHRALAPAGAMAPATPALPRTIRNPFNSFWQRDILFAFCARDRRVKPLPRPSALADQLRSERVIAV
ncbi:hypothetical protein HA397_30185, partial [Escherichia coli]|nr:hypothetical protein [Escherichia coli]